VPSITLAMYLNPHVDSMKLKNGKIIIFAGPSGSGKDTVMQAIMKECNNMVKLTTATTRPMREGEVEGKMYYFQTVDEFKNNVKQGLIPEHNVHADNYYGTYLPDLDKKMKQGKIIVGQVQLVGARYLKKNYKALLIFLKAESWDILRSRIKGRSDLSENEIEKRRIIAEREISEESKFYDYIVENKQGQLDKTIEKVKKIIKENIEC